MAQSTLAYQKEIMRLRTIIQATAPERLRSPVNRVSWDQRRRTGRARVARSRTSGKEGETRAEE